MFCVCASLSFDIKLQKTLLTAGGVDLGDSLSVFCEGGVLCVCVCRGGEKKSPHLSFPPTVFVMRVVEDLGHVECGGLPLSLSLCLFPWRSAALVVSIHHGSTAGGHFLISAGPRGFNCAMVFLTGKMAGLSPSATEKTQAK